MLRYPLRVVKRLHVTRSYTDTSKKSTFRFINRDGSQTEVTAPHGKSILEVAHENNVEIEGACEGSLACSTCHVILTPDLFDNLGEPSEREEDLLDLAPGLTDTSRLCCQLKVDSKFDGTEIRLPKATINFYVDGHTPKPH
jgi:ferredoxin